MNETKRKDDLAEIAAIQKQAANIAREQYHAGVTTQLDLLTAQRGLLDAESDAVLAEAQTAEKLLNIYKAFGK